VNFPDANNPQVEGDLKLMIKPIGGAVNGIEANGVELGIRGAGSGIKVVPVFSSDSASAVKVATANVEIWLGNEAWRNSLLDKTRAATTHLGAGGGFAAGSPANAAARAASGGTRSLEISLERWCK